MHFAEGLVVFTVGITALVHACRPGSFAGSLWTWLVLIAGSMLVIFLAWPHAGVAFSDQAAFILRDAQQRQHLMIAVLLIVGGACQVLSERNNSRGLAIVFPCALGGVGALFLLHTQHGTTEAVAQAVAIHTYLGILLICAAAGRAIEVWRPRVAIVRYTWPVLLLASAALLFVYREPGGAYHSDPRAVVDRLQRWPVAGSV